MKKLLLPVLLFLWVLNLSSFAHTRMSMVIVAGHDIASADYSDIIQWLNLEGTWNADPCTNDGDYDMGASECGFDTEIFCGSDVSQESTSPLVGSYSARCSDTGGNRYFRTDLHATGQQYDKGRMGIWVKHNSGNINSGTVMQLLWDNSPDNQFGLHWYDADQVEVYVRINGSVIINNSVISTTSDFETNGHYVEVAWDFSLGAGSDYVKLYVDGVLEDSDSTLSITDTDATVRYVYCGQFNSTASDWIWDQCFFSTDPTRDFNALKNETSKPSGACP